MEGNGLFYLIFERYPNQTHLRMTTPKPRHVSVVFLERAWLVGWEIVNEKTDFYWLQLEELEIHSNEAGTCSTTVKRGLFLPLRNWRKLNLLEKKIQRTEDFPEIKSYMQQLFLKIYCFKLRIKSVTLFS